MLTVIYIQVYKFFCPNVLSAIYCDLSDTTQNRCFLLNGWSIMEMEIPCRINAKKSINLTLDFMHICSPGLSEPEGDPGRAMPFPPQVLEIQPGEGDQSHQIPTCPPPPQDFRPSYGPALPAAFNGQLCKTTGKNSQIFWAIYN